MRGVHPTAHTSARLAGRARSLRARHGAVLLQVPPVPPPAVAPSGSTLLDWLTAAGTVGAAVVAAVSVVITGRQGQAQQRLLVEERQRDAAERRADFELGLLLELARQVEAGGYQLIVGRRINARDEEARAVRACLIALPPGVLPTLRAVVAPPDDTLAQELLTPHKGENYWRDVQRAVERELRDAIFARRDLTTVHFVTEARAQRRWYDPRRWLPRRRGDATRGSGNRLASQ